MEYFRVALVSVLKDVSSDYGLDHGELVARYVDGSTVKASAVKVPEAPVGTVDTVEETEGSLLRQSQNALKDLCRSRGLKVGGNKRDLVSRLLNPDSGKPKRRGGGRRKVEKRREPEHTHAPDDKIHEGCEACREGNIMVPDAEDYDYSAELEAIMNDQDETVAPVVPATVETVAPVESHEAEKPVESHEAEAPVETEETEEEEEADDIEEVEDIDDIEEAYGMFGLREEGSDLELCSNLSEDDEQYADELAEE